MPDPNNGTITVPAKIITELLPQLSKTKIKAVMDAIQETYKAGYQAGVEDSKKPRV